MTEAEASSLRTRYNAFIRIKENLQNRWSVTKSFLEPSPVRILKRELDALSELKFVEFLMLDFGTPPWREKSYDGTAILAYLDTVLAQAKVIVDRTEITSPIQSREFPSMGDVKLRGVVERDSGELQKCPVSRCWNRP